MKLFYSRSNINCTRENFSLTAFSLSSEVFQGLSMGQSPFHYIMYAGIFK